ncbi:MAG: hypothetical protein F4169_06560 [Gammaproteobacteria bacterium]|nr:hypothetical protein [Gammaproteobacteria bacterium]
MGQFVRAAAASSRERQRRHERAVRDEQAALAAFNARGEKIDAEWNKILARLDNYDAAWERGDAAALQQAFDYVNERIWALAQRNFVHAEEMAVFDPEHAQALTAQVQEQLDEWQEIKERHAAAMQHGPDNIDDVPEAIAAAQAVGKRVAIGLMDGSMFAAQVMLHGSDAEADPVIAAVVISLDEDLLPDAAEMRKWLIDAAEGLLTYENGEV